MSQGDEREREMFYNRLMCRLNTVFNLELSKISRLGMPSHHHRNQHRNHFMASCLFRSKFMKFSSYFAEMSMHLLERNTSRRNTDGRMEHTKLVQFDFETKIISLAT